MGISVVVCFNMILPLWYAASFDTHNAAQSISQLTGLQLMRTLHHMLRFVLQI